jgi:hypothetical protein
LIWDLRGCAGEAIAYNWYLRKRSCSIRLLTFRLCRTEGGLKGDATEKASTEGMLLLVAEARE